MSGNDGGHELDAGRAEAVLRSVRGIVAARVVPGAGGEVREVQVIADHGASADEVARIVETALLAAFGAVVDRDVVSVASPGAGGVARPAPEAGAVVAPGGAAGAEDGGTRGGVLPWPPPRLGAVYVDRRAGEIHCRVTLTWNGSRVLGDAVALDAPGASIRAAAEAALEALRSAVGFAAGPWALDGVTQVDLGGVTSIVAGVRGRSGWDVRHTVGVAVVDESAERAAASATLRAAAQAMAGDGNDEQDQLFLAFSA